MGVKDLWSILTPFCERKPLYELEGKTVAVDLSCWICEAQNVTEYNIQPRMYLRNLYFRTCYLLLTNVRPVFVLEGAAPELKYDTIAGRNAVQFRGARPKTDGVRTEKDRSRFQFVLKRCEEMLGLMGLACVTGKGEAEALCAYLNEDGLVDGCISQDSDCFAYGAKVVYRNFSISQQGAHAASGGSVDVYDIRKIPESLRFGRNKIVALALLCGCDYDDGVHGIGKDGVLKFLERFDDGEVLDRLRGWKKNESLFEEFERKVDDKNRCTSCGHSGKLQGHTKNGCAGCGTTKGCDFTRYREERLQIKNEVNMRKKALATEGFPNEKLIEEFLVRKDNVSVLDLKWKRPDIVNFMKFADKYLTWEEPYAFEKFLPIIGRWQVSHPKDEPLLKPDRIKKTRNPKGVPSYEIIWKDSDSLFKGLTDDETLSTIEPQSLVEASYPDLVERFKQSKIKPKKPSKRKKATKVDEIDKMLQNTSISEPKPKRQAKKKVNTKPIDSYFKKAVLNNFQEAKLTSTPIKANKEESFSAILQMNVSCFEDENDGDLSDIVNEIVQQQPSFLKQLPDFNRSEFFASEPEENDVFERTFNEMCGKDGSEDEDESFAFSRLPLMEKLEQRKGSEKRVLIK